MDEEADKSQSTLFFSDDQKKKVIRGYLAEEKQIKPTDDCIIGVGYQACTDINFMARELIKLLEPKIIEMEENEGKKIEP